MRRAQYRVLEAPQRNAISQTRTIHALENPPRELTRPRSQWAAFLGFDVEEHMVSVAKRQNLIERRNLRGQIASRAVHGIVRNNELPIRREHDIQLHCVRSARDCMPESRDTVFLMCGHGAAVAHHPDGITPWKPVGCGRFG